MEHDNLHAHIFDVVRDPMVVINDRGDVHAANAAALRLFGLAPDAAGAAHGRGPRVDLDVRALADLVRGRQKMHGVTLADRTGRETGIEVDVDPTVGPPGHALLHFRACTASIARELWTDDAVATVAHEFRSPLAGMRSALNVLVGGDAGPLSEHQRRFLGAVQRGVGRLARVVDGYLDLARVRAGVLAVDRAEHDMRGLVYGITGDLALCHPVLASRVDVAIEPSVAGAFVDPDRVAQVVLNLVYNAARFTPDGGRLALRVRPAGREALEDPLRVLPYDVFGEPSFVCIEVEDQGIGMSPDALAHVFDRYYTDSRDAPATGGAHLGLHISRSLVEAQDGWMHMDSRLGEGTTAAVFLPADAATARLLSRLRGAEETVSRLRAARRPVMLAVVTDAAIRDDAAPDAWPSDWAVNPAREQAALTAVWVIRDGVALIVTPRIDAFADSETEHEPGERRIGACRAEEGMTFSGALRAAAASLIETNASRAETGSGIEVTPE